MLSQGSTLTLPKKVREGAMEMIPWRRIRAEGPQLKYVTTFSIDLGLTGNDSAIGAGTGVKFAKFNQMAHANDARQRSWGAA
jgi:hypothetical protein